MNAETEGRKRRGIGAGKGEESESILDYISTMDFKESLYKDVLTCVTVFRSLPSLAKHVIMRMLWLEIGVHHQVIASWVKKESVELLKKAVARLSKLNVVVGASGGLCLDTHFRNSIRTYVKNGATDTGVGKILADKHAPGLEKLAAHAKRGWDRILHFLVYRNVDDPVPVEIQKLLEFSGLLQIDQESKSPNITSKGFRFLFLPHRQQVWSFILGYVRFISSRRSGGEGEGVLVNEQEVLRLLFKLGHSKLGQDYPTNLLSKTQQTILQHLKEFGFVYQRKASSRRYYPTSLALSLSSVEGKGGASDEGLGGEGRESSGRVIVETTFRVEAYTSSKFQIAILSQFVHFVMRLPNVVFGVITRDSIRNALKNGITAQSIIMYLEQHAHPRMKRNPKTGSALPPTVVDQIWLWQQDRERFKLEDSFFLHHFQSSQEFKRVLDMTKAKGFLQWHNEDKQWMTLSPEGFQLVKDWRRAQRKAADY